MNDWCANENSIRSKYGDINSWDVSKVTSMKYLFKNKYNFNSNIENWNTENVTDMSVCFMILDFLINLSEIGTQKVLQI